MFRVTRAAVSAALASPFVEAAYSYGLPRRKIMIRDVFRNASPPILNLMAMTFGYLIGGAVLVERVFSWPGIGFYAVWASERSDYDPVLGVVIVAATIYVTPLLHRGPAAVRDGSASAGLTGDGCWSTDGPRSVPPRDVSLLPEPTRSGGFRGSHQRQDVTTFDLLPFILLIVIFGPWIVTHDPIRPDPFNTLAPPSAEHWFGTDSLGLDIYSRVVAGARIDFVLALVGVVLGRRSGIHDGGVGRLPAGLGGHCGAPAGRGAAIVPGAAPRAGVVRGPRCA